MEEEKVEEGHRESSGGGALKEGVKKRAVVGVLDPSEGLALRETEGEREGRERGGGEVMAWD